MRDAYSAGELFRRRVLPPELVFANPGFLRACQGQPVPADSYLHFYAADLVRTSDGQWRVVADRTNAPLGAGYTLENQQYATERRRGEKKKTALAGPWYEGLGQTLFTDGLGPGRRPPFRTHGNSGIQVMRHQQAQDGPMGFADLIAAWRIRLHRLVHGRVSVVPSRRNMRWLVSGDNNCSNISSLIVCTIFNGNFCRA